MVGIRTKKWEIYLLGLLWIVWMAYFIDFWSLISIKKST